MGQFVRCSFATLKSEKKSGLGIICLVFHLSVACFPLLCSSITRLLFDCSSFFFLSSFFSLPLSLLSCSAIHHSLHPCFYLPPPNQFLSRIHSHFQRFAIASLLLISWNQEKKQKVSAPRLCSNSTNSTTQQSIFFLSAQQKVYNHSTHHIKPFNATTHACR